MGLHQFPGVLNLGLNFIPRGHPFVLLILKLIEVILKSIEVILPQLNIMYLDTGKRICDIYLVTLKFWSKFEQNFFKFNYSYTETVKLLQ